jgi:hypothetical protein
MIGAAHGCVAYSVFLFKRDRFRVAGTQRTFIRHDYPGTTINVQLKVVVKNLQTSNSINIDYARTGNVVNHLLPVQPGGYDRLTLFLTGSCSLTETLRRCRTATQALTARARDPSAMLGTGLLATSPM